MSTFVTIADHIMRRVPSLKAPVPVYGRIHDGHISAWSLEPNVFLQAVGIATSVVLPEDRVQNVPLILLFDGPSEVHALVMGDDHIRAEVAIHQVGAQRDLQARQRGILETGQLARKSIKFIGAGSVTAKMARPLVEAGVGTIGFADGQTLAPENIGRHALGVDAIGLPKAVALCDQMKLVNPELKATALTVPLSLETRAQYRAYLKGATLVVIATDSMVANLLAQDVCLELGGIPAVVVGCWERAFAGEIIYSDPRKGTACYGCIREALPGADAAKGPVDYSSAATADGPPQPGLGADVNFVAAVAAKVCLVHLTKDWKAGLVSRTSSVLLVSNRAEEMFAQACQVAQVKVKPKVDCWLCSHLQRTRR